MNLQNTKKILPWLCLITGGCLIGLRTGLGKLAVAAGWQPLAFMFWSLLLGGFVLLAAARLFGVKPSLDKAHLTYYFIAGLISLAIPIGLTFTSIPHVGVGFASLCEAFPPLVTYVLATAIGMERLKMIRAAGILCGLVGAILLTLGKIGEDNASPAWMLVAMTAPVFLGLGNIYRKRYWPAGADALALAPGMMLAGAVPLAVFAAISGIALSTAPAGAWASALFIMQAVILAAMYAIFLTLQKTVGVMYMSQVGSIGMVAGTAFAVAALGEELSPLLPPAGMMIFFGVLLVTRRKEARQPYGDTG
ncbi:MAG: DMT family transporter [Planctomycetes bacterium]|nr:DMT family transporter [Planctomycetota bacterium]